MLKKTFINKKYHHDTNIKKNICFMFLLFFKSLKIGCFLKRKTISFAKILKRLILDIRGLQGTDTNIIHECLLCDTTSLRLYRPFQRHISIYIYITVNTFFVIGKTYLKINFYDAFEIVLWYCVSIAKYGITIYKLLSRLDEKLITAHYTFIR